MMVLPGPRPRPELKPNRTRGLVRRATPIFAIAAVIALQAGLGLAPVLVFPLYLLLVLLTAFYSSRLDSFFCAVLAAIGVAAPSLLAGGSTDRAVPLLLAAVLLIVAVSVHEVVGRIATDLSLSDKIQKRTSPVRGAPFPEPSRLGAVLSGTRRLAGFVKARGLEPDGARAGHLTHP